MYRELFIIVVLSHSPMLTCAYSPHVLPTFTETYRYVFPNKACIRIDTPIRTMVFDKVVHRFLSEFICFLHRLRLCEWTYIYLAGTLHRDSAPHVKYFTLAAAIAMKTCQSKYKALTADILTMVKCAHDRLIDFPLIVNCKWQNLLAYTRFKGCRGQN